MVRRNCSGGRCRLEWLERSSITASGQGRLRYLSLLSTPSTFLVPRFEFSGLALLGHGCPGQVGYRVEFRRLVLFHLK
jgi:hypothetical protein